MTPPGSNTGVSNYNGYRTIASALDWLTVTALQSLPDDRLVEVVRSARSEDGPHASGYQFAGEDLYIKAGNGAYLATLHNDWLHVDVSTDGEVATVRYTLYSAALWELGECEAVDFLQVFADSFQTCEHVDLVPSRLDLCRDVAGFSIASELPLGTDLRSLIVSRAKSLDARGDRYTGCQSTQTVYVGVRGGPVLLRMYDKLADNRAKKHEARYLATWQANGYDGAAPVTRFEWELRRAFFREYLDATGQAVTDVWSLLDCLPGIWAYLTERHTRIVVPEPAQSNRSRLAAAPIWKVVSLPFVPDVTAVAGCRVSRRAPVLEQLAAQVAGCLLSYLAIVPDGETLQRSGCAAVALGMVGDLERRRHTTLRELVLKRRAELVAA